MDFTLPEEVTLFRDQLQKFIDKELRTIDEKPGFDPDQEIDLELKKKCRKRSAELGFWAAHMPEELGGGGLPHVAMAALRDAPFSSGCSLPFLSTPGPECPTPLLSYANHNHVEHFVTPLINGETSMAFVLT